MQNMTKKKIATGLKRLMSVQSLDKLTVTHLVKHLGITRQVFYYHFHDIYELLSWIYATELSEAVSSYSIPQSWRKGLLASFYYLLDNKEFVFNTYKSLDRETIEKMIYDCIMPVAQKIVGTDERYQIETLESQRFVAKSYTFILIGLLLEWIKNRLVESPDKIVSQFVALY